MPEIAALLDAEDPRVALLRDGPTDAEGRCVLLWVQRAQRASGNLAANQAVGIADALGLPVVAAFCLVPAFPSANLRTYRFMAEGLRELPAGFAARGIGWDLRVGEPRDVLPALAADLGAAAVVTDQNPLRIGRAWRAEVAERLRVPLVAVDADVVVPSALFPKEEWAARTIRPKLARHLDRFLVPTPDPAPRRPSDHRAGPDPVAALDGLALDRRVAPVADKPGGTAAARERLKTFVRDRLGAYDTDRDRPERRGQSELGPYLHYGQISPVEVALAVRASRAAGARADAADSFLDELITQRELSVNFALRNPAYDRYAGLPDWGRKTLAEHAADPRPALFSRARLEAGETGDPLWDAAQRQMVAEGFMPNRLRMYWAKQILRWTATPEEAFETTRELNDRYFLCGRDAAGYANIAWAIGGRHDRPFPPNKSVLGLVRPMGLPGMRRRFDVDAYVAAVNERIGPP